MPSGTPFRLGALLDQNAGKMFVLLRQKITLPYRRVFKNWVLKELLKDLKGEDIFNLTGDADMVDQLREIIVDSWYVENLVAIGPHTREQGIAIKEVKLEELKKKEPTIKNSEKIWKGVFERLFVTITGENSDMADNIQDIVTLLSMEKDPDRISFLLDSIYKIRGIPVPPRVEPQGQEQGDEPVTQPPEPERTAAQPVVA